jgi:hypothetical protein
MKPRRTYPQSADTLLAFGDATAFAVLSASGDRGLRRSYMGGFVHRLFVCGAEISPM